jgi:hypothetical protein
MNPQQSFEKYIESLKAMGLNDEAIGLYLQNMEQSAQIFAGQMAQLNTMFGDQQEDVNEFVIVNNPDTKLTRAEQWAVACGADLAFYNGSYLNDLPTGMTRQESRTLLSSYWDIDSPEEAVEAIEMLFTEGNRMEFDTLWQAVNMVSMKECKEFLRETHQNNEAAEAIALHRLRNLRDAIEVFKQHNLFEQSTLPDMLAWDFCRIINLSRGCYDGGYLTSEQAIGFIMRSAREIRKTYTGWKQLSISYQFARYIWKGIDEDHFQQFLKNMQVLLTDPNSPWVLLKWDDGVVV